MLCSLALLPENVSTRNVSLHSAAFNALAGFRDASPFHGATAVDETDSQSAFHQQRSRLSLVSTTKKTGPPVWSGGPCVGITSDPLLIAAIWENPV